MSMSGEQRQIQHTHEHAEIQVHAQPIQEERQQPQLVQPVHAQAAPVEAQREIEENAALAAQVRQQLPAAHAEEAAPGTPVQEEAATKMTWKERRREKKHAAAAKKACPVGTAATYDMVKQLTTLDVGKENALRDYRDLAERQKVDKRVLKIFSTPYQVNKKGQPASPEDAAAKQQADAFLQDYCSNDVQRRQPHLDRMVNELLATQFSPNMFSPRNLRKNAAQLKELGDKMVYMDNVMLDPINRPYFDRMDPARRERLEAAFHTLYIPFVGALATEFRKNGVEMNTGKYYGYNDTMPIESGQMMSAATMAGFRTALDQYQTQEADIAARQVTRVRDCAQDYARRMGENTAALDQVKADPQFQLQPGEQTSAYLTRTVMLLQPGEEHQDENLETVRTCLELGRVGTSARPTPQLYQKARDMLAPRVQRVLDCDVEHFAQMDDEALLTCSPQLNDLSMDNMFVADLMKLQHHSLSDPDGSPITLEDDLVGQRTADYAYKLSMLRGLSERARALAILRQQETGGGVDQTYFTSEEWNSSGASADPAGWAKRCMEVGATTIQTARKTLHDQLTPGAPAYQENLARMRVQEERTRQLLAEGPLFAAGRSMFEEDTQEKRDIVKRLKALPYTSLAHSPEELRARGLPASIDEPLFRTYTGFLSTEAAQKLLTPERFEQMLRDLGAGANLENAPPEARQEAIERNNRGLVEYKRVIRAQYDMIARKYGASLLTMSLQEILLHRQDILGDFIDAQVPLDMATKHPDFLDENDPEDRLLGQRIEYYSFMGKAVSDLANAFCLAFTSEKDVEETTKQMWALRSRNLALEGNERYLAEHDPQFTHGADWKQTVRVPEDEGPGRGNTPPPQ